MNSVLFVTVADKDTGSREFVKDAALTRSSDHPQHRAGIRAKFDNTVHLDQGLKGKSQ
jgi:hypothetical protein